MTTITLKVYCISPECNNFVIEWIDDLCIECLIRKNTLRKERLNKRKYLKSPNPFGLESSPFDECKEYKKQIGCLDWIKTVFECEN